MKIIDFINDLPKKVKLNKNFTLEESFGVNTILLIKSAVVEEWSASESEMCYKVYVTALAEDMDYNRSIAITDWFDDNNQPILMYYDINKKRIDGSGNLNDIIFVMENDDCFDEIKSKSPDIVDNNITNILTNLRTDLIFKTKALNALGDSERIQGKIEGINVVIEDIRRILNDLEKSK